MGTLYLDVSLTADVLSRHPQGTGVMRVTLTLAERLAARRECLAYIDLPGTGGPFVQPDLSAGGLALAGQRTLPEYLSRYDGKPLKRAFHWARLACRAGAMARRGIAGVGARPARMRVPRLTSHDTLLRCNLGEPMGDIGMRLIKSSGCRVAGIVHDTIPLSHPHYGSAVSKVEFASHIKQFATLNPLWICVSRNTEADFKREAHKLGIDAGNTVVVPLAHEFIHKRLQPVSVPEKYIMFVGSRGKRKGLRCLAEAFAKFSLTHPDVHLVLAGQGRCHEIQMAKNIHFIDYPTDDQLAYLYKHCMFTVYPSEYEGWGLPVGESLWFGKPVITCTNSSLPEVGGTNAHYVPTNDASALAAAMSAYCCCRLPRQCVCLRTWDNVADDLHKALVRAEEEAQVDWRHMVRLAY